MCYMSQTSDPFKDNQGQYYKMFLDKITEDQYDDLKNM